MKVPAERREEVEALVRQRLSQPEVQQKVLEAVLYYYLDFRETTTFAEVLNDGTRPEGLANEVYACFHHLARGLSEKDADAVEEIEKARSSHLKRLALDSNKIILNRILTEVRPYADMVDTLTSVEHLHKLVNGGLDTLVEIRNVRDEVVDLYQRAKRAEGRGFIENHNPEQALTLYEQAVEKALQLKAVTKDKLGSSGIFFAYKEYQDNKLRQIDALRIAEATKRRSTWSLIIAIIAIISSAIVGIYTSGNFSHNNQTTSEQSHIENSSTENQPEMD